MDNERLQGVDGSGPATPCVAGTKRRRLPFLLTPVGEDPKISRVARAPVAGVISEGPGDRHPPGHRGW